MPMVPLDADEKAALRNFFKTYVVPLLAMILLIWAAQMIIPD